MTHILRAKTLTGTPIVILVHENSRTIEFISATDKRNRTRMSFESFYTAGYQENHDVINQITNKLEEIGAIEWGR